MSYNLTTNQIIFLVILALWDAAWKALALWRAARRNQPYWFLGILIINSAGILPVLYLLSTLPVKTNPRKRPSHDKETLQIIERQTAHRTMRRNWGIL